jgi:NAD(P)-dependent dehydrogenase (short-subunit alcohol dehydrogenase family)
MANTYDLTGRVALITGASGGLGPAVVRAFVEAGATVEAVARTPQSEERAEMRAQLGAKSDKLSLQVADVLVEDSVSALVERVIRERGRLDVTLNLVGGFAAGQSITDLPYERWQQMLDLNLRSTFLVSKYVARPMRQQAWGRIINFSSRSAFGGRRNAAAYAVAKSAVITLTETQAEELRDTGVTVNALVPSIIDTPANRKGMPNAAFDSWPKPEEIARVLLFLASDDSSLISGAAIPVYGRA